jgi:AcrR family transcriptional regulator
MGKREDILNATMSIVSKHGFQNVTIADVLEKANTGVGTLYNYFQGKDDLIKNLYVEIKDQVSRDILSNIAAANGIRPRFENYIVVYLDYCIHHLDWMIFIEQYAYFTNTSEYYNDRMNDQQFYFVHSILKDGQDQKLIKPVQTEVLMDGFCGIVMYVAKGVNSNHYTLSDNDLEGIVNACWDCVKL